jgi:ketosteroid isomerase-like protein
MPTVARWPLEVGDEFGMARPRDPWVSLVRDSIDLYRTGEADRASRTWAEDIRWTVDADGPIAGVWEGADAIFGYHRHLERTSQGTYRQRLLALEASGGPIVEAHLRTTASRPGSRLDQPTLVVFELSGGQLKRVIEIPGDRDAWRTFWSG